MYRSPYDITPVNNNPIEDKIRRDEIQFPQALPANSHVPIHSMDYTFLDRNLKNDRKDCKYLPVQNDYLQKYQIHELQQINYGYETMEQSQIDRIMNRKQVMNYGQLDRNKDDALLFNKNNVIENTLFTLVPQDTRREKIELNNSRIPMSKVLGAPPKYNQNSYI